MPSPLETLVKILKLERDQGCRNTAVIGGLATYGENWKKEALARARKAEHYVLVEELIDLLKKYEAIESATERHQQIGYMLDRIMGRVPIPREYEARLSEFSERAQSGKPQTPVEPAQLSQQQGAKSAPLPETQAEKAAQQEMTARKTGRYDVSPQPPEISKRRQSRVKLDVATLPTLMRPPRKPRPSLDPDKAWKMLSDLEKPVTEIKGIGGKSAEDLGKLGIYTIRDILYYLPRCYNDYTQLRPVRRLTPETDVTVIGTVKRAEGRAGRGGRRDFFLILDDGTAELAVIFFNQHYLHRSIKVGQQIALQGRVSIFRNQLQMANPEWEHLDSENLLTTGIVPVYPLTQGLKPRSFRRLMKQVVDTWADRVIDYIPESTLERTELADLGWTIKNLHFPEGWDHLRHARRRFIFDELLLLQLGILQNRREWQSVSAQPLEVSDDFLENFIQVVFPYALTGAQQRAIAAIREDARRVVPMNRLIQGDVGSGKTAVAIVAMAMAIVNGKQAALMAPTSILAEQHYRTIRDALLKMPAEQKPVIALLTGALTNMERESIYRGLADGSIDLVIGTHALIQGGVEFKDLAVAVVDEQHRFGVEQRKALRGKGTNPHLLVMTATPIPRTLALTIYADLDLTIIDEKPPGRQPVKTKVLLPVERERAFSFIEAQIEQGRQTFIIHPLVEASESIDARSAVEAFEELRQVFYKYRVCLLHGRMTAGEKEEIMTAFAKHEYDVMVTTSVAEVGVDVPNASVILIEGANRFGLSQLHQFRGRVGRGEHPSFCLLIPDSMSEDAERRLRAVEETEDGFRLAEMDWKIRGAGDLLGTRQSGRSKLQLAEMMTPELVELAQREARTIYEEDVDLSQQQHVLLRQQVEMLRSLEGDVS